MRTVIGPLSGGVWALTEGFLVSPLSLDRTTSLTGSFASTAGISVSSLSLDRTFFLTGLCTLTGSFSVNSIFLDGASVVKLGVWGRSLVWESTSCTRRATKHPFFSPFSSSSTSFIPPNWSSSLTVIVALPRKSSGSLIPVSSSKASMLITWLSSERTKSDDSFQTGARSFFITEVFHFLGFEPILILQ